MKKTLLKIYLWCIAIPVAVILTMITTILMMITSPLAPKSRWAHAIPKVWAKLVCLFLLIKVKVYGLENVSPAQSYIYVSNHQSIVDIFVIYGWLPSVFKWIMKADLFKVPFVGLACKAAGHIFIDRQSGKDANKSIIEAKKKLQGGVSVMIFPEGTRTRTGEMGRFKKGAFRIAEDIRLPLVPVTLRGSFERLPRNHGPKFSPGLVEMFIHKPIEIASTSHLQENDLMQQTWNVINEKLRIKN